MKKKGGLEVLAIQFWSLLTPHKHKLYNFIQKSLNFSEDANDIFQETVMRAFRYFHSYQRDKEFTTWIFAIAHNEVKKYFKRAGKFVCVPNIDMFQCAGSDDSHELVQDVYRFAERLKPKHRQVFFLFYYNGFAISEISQITGIKEGTVKFLLSRARNDLKKILGEQGERIVSAGQIQLKQIIDVRDKAEQTLINTENVTLKEKGYLVAGISGIGTTGRALILIINAEIK